MSQSVTQLMVMTAKRCYELNKKMLLISHLQWWMHDTTCIYYK